MEAVAVVAAPAAVVAASSDGGRPGGRQCSAASAMVAAAYLGQIGSFPSAFSQIGSLQPDRFPSAFSQIGSFCSLQPYRAMPCLRCTHLARGCRLSPSEATGRPQGSELKAQRATEGSIRGEKFEISSALLQVGHLPSRLYYRCKTEGRQASQALSRRRRNPLGNRVLPVASSRRTPGRCVRGPHAHHRQPWSLD